jgi:hypothetical protein
MGVVGDGEAQRYMQTLCANLVCKPCMSALHVNPLCKPKCRPAPASANPMIPNPNHVNAFNFRQHFNTFDFHQHRVNFRQHHVHPCYCSRLWVHVQGLGRRV